MKKLILLICMSAMGSLCWAQTAPSLGSAASFAVLGNAVTCTAPTVITGDVGATGAFTNTGCTITGGTPPATNVAAVAAQLALTSAYNAINPINPINCGTTISTAAFTNNLPVLAPLPPGVYCFPAAVTFTDTTLTLDGSTNPNGIWIFEVDAALTGNGFQVVMINGAQPCNVFWSVGAAVALSTSTLPPLFQGNILAGSGAAITTTGGILIGRALANGAVTMTGTNIQGSCELVAQAVAQATASCTDNDHEKDKDRDHEKDKDKDKDRDHEKDKDHEKEKDRDR